MTDEAKGVEAAARAAHSVVTGATPNPVAWESLSVLEQCSWIAAMRAALAQPKEGEALSDEVVERAARADADMAAALLEGLEALANTPMNIDFSVWSRFAFNVQMIAKRLRRAAITPAGGVSGQYLYEAFWKRQPDQDKRPTPPWSEQSDAIKTMWDGIAGDATSSRDDAAPQQEGGGR